MKLLLPGLTAVLAGSLAMATAGEITGKVTLKGKPKDEIPIDLGPACGPLNPNNGKVTTRHYVVSPDGGLANVFVYLKDAKAAPATGEGPLLDQVGCMYEPFVLGVVVNRPQHSIRPLESLVYPFSERLDPTSRRKSL